LREAPVQRVLIISDKPVDAILLIISSPCAIHAADHANHIGFPSGINIDMPPGDMRHKEVLDIGMCLRITRPFLPKEDDVFIDMLPNNLAAWVSLLGACFIGFMIGKWLHARRNKTMPGSGPITWTESTRQAKRVSKKERLKARRSLK
jgi:hypothetical protein